MSTPQQDRHYRAWRARTIEGAHAEKPAQMALSFRERALLLCKKHGLTRTCAILDWKL